MKKNSLKFVIDAALFIDICSIAIIGLFLAFIVPKGKMYGAQKYFLGLHRHQWTDIHLYLSLTLLILLIFHIWFNWKWIAHSTKQYFGDKWEFFLIIISCSWIFVLILAWIFVAL